MAKQTPLPICPHCGEKMKVRSQLAIKHRNAKIITMAKRGIRDGELSNEFNLSPKSIAEIRKGGGVKYAVGRPRG